MAIPVTTLYWFALIFICSNSTITRAQPPDFIYYICQTTGNYTRNSTYQKNLNSTLSALPSTNSGQGFFNTTRGQGSDTVNSFALCRGDVNPDICRRCLNDSIVNLPQVCPNQKEAIGYYDFCLLIYSNQTILGSNLARGRVIMRNMQNTTNEDQFNAAIRPLLNNLIDDAAAGDSLRKFATGNTSGPDFSTIFGLAQCSPDLTLFLCGDCLQNAVTAYFNQYSNKVGGRIIGPKCNFRFESYAFFNVSTLVIPSPPPSPPPAPRTSPPVISPPPAFYLNPRHIPKIASIHIRHYNSTMASINC